MAGLMWQFKLSQLLQDNSYKCSAAAETGDRLATIGMGRKVGGCCALSVAGELGPLLTQCHLGGGLPPYQVAS